MTTQTQSQKVIEAFSPPADMAMEQSVLGSVLLKPAVLDEIIGQVEPTDFYREAHRKIFQAMMDLYQQQQPVDLVTVNNLLKDRGQMEEVGGSLYLSSLSEQVGIAANAAYYARGVKDKARLRELINFCQETMASCLQDGAKAAEFYDQVESRVFEITQTRNLVHPVNISELVTQEYETLTKIYESKKKPGFETGFVDLDKVVSLKPKDMSILAARPSMGKTALGLNIAHYLAAQGLPVAFFSLEMSKEQLARRTMAARGSVNGVKIDQVSMAPQEWGRLCGVQDEVEEWPLEIDDTPALSVLDIRARARRLKAKQDLKLIVVDYLQLMRPVTKRGSREQEVADTSRGLKALAKELGVHILALAQLNRELEKRPNKRPKLSDLRECLPVDEWVDTPSGPVQLKTRPNRIITVAVNETKATDCSFIEKRYNRTYRVVTQFGAFSATARHEVLTGVGWKPVRDILPGRDVIACPKRIPHENRGYLPHGRLLGWLIGNGYLSGTPCLVYRNELDAAVRSAVATFGVTVRPRQEQRSGNVTEAFLSNGVESGCLANPLMEWIRTLGLEGKTAKEKTIPRQYLGTADETHKEVLRGLWEADGTVANGKAKYATCNEVLARQVKWLLHTIGVRSTVGYYENGHTGMWEVRCAMQDNIHMQEICAEKQRFGELSASSSRYIDPAPSIFVELAIELYSGEQRIQRRTDGAVKQISKARMENILAECPIATISESPYMTMNDMGWARVAAVEVQDADVRVCDLHVPETHSFLTNGLVVHNSGSIEQDADVVLFIYRDEVYRKDSPDKGIAEIIIGKQRNGKANLTVKLAFLDDYLRFESLAHEPEPF